MACAFRESSASDRFGRAVEHDPGCRRRGQPKDPSAAELGQRFGQRRGAVAQVSRAQSRSGFAPLLVPAHLAAIAAAVGSASARCRARRTRRYSRPPRPRTSAESDRGTHRSWSGWPGPGLRCNAWRRRAPSRRVCDGAHRIRRRWRHARAAPDAPGPPVGAIRLGRKAVRAGDPANFSAAVQQAFEGNGARCRGHR